VNADAAGPPSTIAVSVRLEGTIRLSRSIADDAGATSRTNEERSNVAHMERKGMMPKGWIRNVWKSPQLPNSPWAMHADRTCRSYRHHIGERYYS
jgi:hypothetical protein